MRMGMWNFAPDGTPSGWTTQQSMEIYKACCRSIMMCRDDDLIAQYEILMHECLMEMGSCELHELVYEGFGFYLGHIEKKYEGEAFEEAR